MDAVAGSVIEAKGGQRLVSRQNTLEMQENEKVSRVHRRTETF